MAVLDIVAEEFSERSIQRGNRYFEEGRVKLKKIRDGIVRASVRGSLTYPVAIIDLGDDTLEYDCDCPYFQDEGEHCKHIWATLLAAEERGWGPLADIDEDEPLAARGVPDVDMSFGINARGGQQRSTSASKPHAPAKAKAKPEQWKRVLSDVNDRMRYSGGEGVALPPQWAPGREVFYVISMYASYGDLVTDLYIETHARQPRKDGSMGKLKVTAIDGWEWLHAPDPQDRAIGPLLLGSAIPQYGSGAGDRFTLPRWAWEKTLKPICQTGRCLLRTTPPPAPIPLDPLRWDENQAPWEFSVTVVPIDRGYWIEGTLERDKQRMPLQELTFTLSSGLIIAHGMVSRLDHRGAFSLMEALRSNPSLTVSKSRAAEFLQQFYNLRAVPRIQWPADLGVTELSPAPRPRLRLKPPPRGEGDMLSAKLQFDYDGLLVKPDAPSTAIVQAAERRVILRDRGAEARACQRLTELGFRRGGWDWRDRDSLRLPSAHLSRAVAELTRDGWHVEADGKLYRMPGELHINVSSGIDWFELNGKAEFGDQSVALPALLAALERGQNTVVLDDGTVGLVPEEWLRRYAPFVQLGEVDGDRLRFSRAQAGFLDALLASMPEVRCDEIFERVRQEFRNFSRVEPANAPVAFTGMLRPYQEEGLGWLGFLERFNFGGCLADDMGLGKTVQVLALLAGRRRGDSGLPPSLVVAPRSLVFNWMQEASRFAPALRVLDQSGAGRQRDTSHLGEYDLILTTYGTLRRDAGYFKDFIFDYVILDEAQTIKNAGTQAAKAARLLRARNRLALSGTPIENRLSDLWSLFEFLNPGMLGSIGVFRALSTVPSIGGSNGDGNGHADAGRQLIARALRPFILRRTKEQVASDLPEKFEQTLFCELEPAQRKLYDELRDHYRQSLLARVDAVGMNRAKIQVLEALLRLRQAACHPGLIDKTQKTASSAKLDALREQLDEVLAEGHKALVFSQFTSLLSIVRGDLDRRGVAYEYLDGKTRDRQRRVDRFQNDSACKLFLISLKAGGLGLNLTEADYVFLLDPWWNPAVEAQAVDRAHRIGQRRNVFAYRLIARNTVEEKVLELQRSKRELADAIINEDNSLIARMGREELELLLG